MNMFEQRELVSWVRKMVSENVFFYKLWFYSVRKYQGDYVRLPTADDDFYFDGYPRSGNTYFAGFVKEVYSCKNFASHLHSLSGLKIALKLNLPIFVIIRKPKDAIVSNLYRKVIDNNSNTPYYKKIERLIGSYIKYYLFVRKHIEHINIVNFDLCVNNGLLLIHQIAQTTGFESKPDSLLRESLGNFQKKMKNKETQKDSKISSLPNIHRVNFKEEYLKKVLNSPSYGRAQKLYNELIKYDFITQNNVAES